MDVKSELVCGFKAEPKYIPVWYRYDKLGSGYNDRCLAENTYYYFYRAEVDIITQHVQEIISEVTSPLTLVEMGSGNSEKTRAFIDAILTRQKKLTYVPVDISADFLQETSDALSRDYGSSLHVQPVPGDYSVGFAKLRDLPGRKLILWLGGGFQNQAYNVQVERIRSLANYMTHEDRLLVALDVTQEKEAVENAYLDPTGASENLYLNALWRLNRDLGANVNTDNFRLEANFERETSDDKLSKVTMAAVSEQAQIIDIPGLDMKVTLREEEPIYLHEGEGVSCKYTEAQIRTFVEKGSQRLHKLWTDQQNHVALCCIAK